MDIKKERLKIVANGYDDYAEDYDKAYQDKFSQAEELLIFDIIDRSVFKRRGLVLDMGCGTGLLLRRLPHLENDVVGYDISLNMMSLAKRDHPHAAFFHMAHEDIQPEEYDDIEFHFSLFASPSYTPIKDMLKIIQSLRESSLFTSQGLFMFYGSKPRCKVPGYYINPVEETAALAREIMGDDVKVFPMVRKPIGQYAGLNEIQIAETLRGEIHDTDTNYTTNYYTILAYGTQILGNFGF